MSKHDEEEETEGWQEYWLVCGGVSEQATEAIESVGGQVIFMRAQIGSRAPHMYAVCLLHHQNDDDQGYVYFTDDDEQARRLFICSAGIHHTLYIHCADGSVPRFESVTTQLRIVTEAEWFALADANNKDKPAL